MKYIIFFVLSFFCIESTFAQTIQSSKDDDAFINIEMKLSDLEDTIKSITNATEQSNYNQAQLRRETSSIIQQLNYNIEELKKRQEENNKKMAQYELEMQNLKNITQLLKDDMTTSLKADMMTLQDNMLKLNDTMSTIATSEPLSLLDSNNIDNNILPNQPSDNLLITPTPTPTFKNEAQILYDEGIKSYNNNDFKESTNKFAELLKTYPDDENLYNSLYYLGLSLSKLGHQIESCQSFKTILDSEEANNIIKNNALLEFNNLNCNTMDTIIINE